MLLVLAVVCWYLFFFKGVTHMRAYGKGDPTPTLGGAEATRATQESVVPSVRRLPIVRYVARRYAKLLQAEGPREWKTPGHAAGTWRRIDTCFGS